MLIDVDGTERDVRDDGTLLDALREDLGIHWVKDGCSPQGQCGACSVLVDGEPRLACVTPLRRVAGRSVATAAGLAEPQRSRLAAAFSQTGGFVCGFCTPGILVRAHALLGSGDKVDRAAIDKALASNLCRCTGWQGVVDGIELAASDRTIDPVGNLDVPTGMHRFLADRGEDVVHWIAPVLAGRVGGTLQAVSGEGLLTAADLASRDLPYGRILSPGDAVHDAGDIVALAYGDRLSEARAAAAAASVAIDVIDTYPTPTEAGATPWRTPPWDPGFLEPEAAFARFGEGILEVRSQTETSSEEERLLGLAWPELEVRVEAVTNGGSYGGKAGAGPAALAALAAEAMGAPCMVVFDRRDSILWHRRRRPARWDIRLEADDRGVLRRIDGRLVMAGGGADPGPNPYAAAASVQVVTEPGRPAAGLRAEGSLQWTYALETEIDRCGIDRAASLHQGPAAALAALVDCDGVGVAGSPDSAVAAGVRLDADGRIGAVVLACHGTQASAEVRDAVISGAYMGLGCVLGEDLPMRDGVPTPATIRSLGLLRCGATPPFEVIFVGSQSGTHAPEVDAFAVAAVPPAVANAVAARFGRDDSPLPLKDTPPAKLSRRR